MAQLRQGLLPAALLLVRRAACGQGEGRLGARRLGSETKVADVEIFLEAVRLEEVGEFESADVAALSADLTLEVGDDGAQILERVAQAQQFIPAPFPVKAQAQALTGELAIELVGLADGGGSEREGNRVGHTLGVQAEVGAAAGGSSPAAPGTRSIAACT